jgi:transposase
VPNTVDAKDFLPHPTLLTLGDVAKDSQGWMVETTASSAAACPDCGVVSTSRHSSYLRTLTDLPIQGVAVSMRVQAGRWRCRNAGCQRQIFCQRLDPMAHKHGRETDRCREVFQQVAYALGGRPAERLTRSLGMRRSRHTLLRAIKRRAKPCLAESTPVIGVDDWAWRKGARVTEPIVVDLKQGVVADLLPASLRCFLCRMAA